MNKTHVNYIGQNTRELYRVKMLNNTKNYNLQLISNL